MCDIRLFRSAYTDFELFSRRISARQMILNGIVIIRSTESSWKKNKMIYDTEELYGRICHT